MTSYRLILLLIISLTALGLPPGSVGRSLEAYGFTRVTSLESESPISGTSPTALLSSLLQTANAQRSSVTSYPKQFPAWANAKGQANPDFSDISGVIETAANQGKSKKDLFWMALIGFSTIFGAGIFAGLFYLLTSSSWEIEQSESEIAEELDAQATADSDFTGSDFDRHSENGLAPDEAARATEPQEPAQQNLDSQPTTTEPQTDRNLPEVAQNSPEISPQQPRANPPQTTPPEGIHHPSEIAPPQQPTHDQMSEFTQNIAGNSDNNNQKYQTHNTPEAVQTSTPNSPSNSPVTQTNIQSPQTSTDDLNHHIQADNRDAAQIPKSPESSQPESQSLAIEETTRLAKIDIIEELITDLQSPDPTKRRKSIWELGQRGDSRAVQPLVDSIVDSDSKQVSLILGALSEIGTRTLKPMNRALALSLQDRNPDVRKNAIRDLTRIYDLISQISQLLRHAVDDSDVEVQETARWALNQLSQINTMSSYQPRSALHNWTHPVDTSPEDLS